MNRIGSEKKTVGMMVRLYCRRYEGNKELCQDCREKMRAVMRWAGPRMMIYHPIEAIKHLIREKF